MKKIIVAAAALLSVRAMAGQAYEIHEFNLGMDRGGWIKTFQLPRFHQTPTRLLREVRVTAIGKVSLEVGGRKYYG